ncbi:MAG: OmpA family protein [Deltaproteobacteria bacterium]|nr:OmpA family protein [Deltaproteobacteria bacterium]
MEQRKRVTIEAATESTIGLAAANGVLGRLLFFFMLLMLWAMSSVRADGPFIGLNLGTSEPTNDNYRSHVDTGATVAPFGGYMFNDYFGLQGGLDFNAMPPDGKSQPAHAGLDRPNQWTTMLGVTAGPRLQLPLGDRFDLYVTGQGGGFKGLGGRLNQLAPGFQLGGGFDFNLTPQVAIGLFGNWNRAYMAPHPTFLSGHVDNDQGPKDARWVTAGVGLKYAFNQPEEAPAVVPPPPPPPPVAKVAPPAPQKKKIVLRSVHFDFDKSVIRADAVPVLNEAADTLKEEGGVAVIVEGHTDSKGSDAYNEKLSKRRADAVRQYLVKHGIPSNRITAEGFGESRPVASNDTDDGRAENRRVELRVE